MPSGTCITSRPAPDPPTHLFLPHCRRPRCRRANCTSPCRFIKQEAEEKASEIGVSAEEEFNITKLQVSRRGAGWEREGVAGCRGAGRCEPYSIIHSPCLLS